MKNDIDDVKARSIEILSARYGLHFKGTGRNPAATCPGHGGAGDLVADRDKHQFHCRGACNFSGDVFDWIGKIEGKTFHQVRDELLGHAGNSGNRQHDHDFEDLDKMATTGAPAGTKGQPCGFAYRNSEGLVIGGINRTDHPDGSKSFRQWRHDGNGGWEHKAPVLPPPYGLPELLARPDAPVLVVEGEKSAEAAQRAFPAFVCTTSLGGSSAPHKTDWSKLKGRDVTSWPDADGPGFNYASKVSAELSLKHGVTVHVVDVAELHARFPTAWDLADPLPDGVTDEDIARMLRDAKPLAPDAKNPWTSTDGPESTQSAESNEDLEPEVLPVAPRFPSLSDIMEGTGRSRIYDVMPPPLATYLESVAASQELSAESVLVSALPTIALAIGPDVVARGNGQHLETLSTWDMAVLPPGGRKSAGFAACQEALSELRGKLEDEGRVRRAEWSSRESCREQEEKVLRSRVGAYYAGKYGEGKPGSKPPTAFDLMDCKARLAEIVVERLSDPDPGRVEICSSNATPEAVVERVAAARSFAMLSAEGATVIEGLAEYRGGDDGAPIGHWCSLYSGDEVRSTRAGRETLTVPAKTATLSVGITLQRDVLDRAQDNRSMRTRGFLTRFSKYFPTAAVPQGAKPPPRNQQAEEWWDTTVRCIAARRPAKRTELVCSSEAAAMLREFELECRARAADPDDLGDEPAVAEWAVKAHGMALRKAALFHAIQGFDYATPISTQTLGWAIAMTRMGLDTEIALAQSGRGGVPRRLHRFGELVRKSGLHELTARVAAKKGWANDVETARTMLGHLVEHKWLWVESRKNPRAGRPSIVYVVNPRIHSMTPDPPPGRTGEKGREGGSAGFAEDAQGGQRSEGPDDGVEI